MVLGAPQQLPALETGTVDAGIFNPPFDFYAKNKKFREVLDVGAKVKMPLGGLTTMLSTIRNRPDEVRRVLRSMQLAKQEVLRSKEKATAMILKYLQVDKEAADDTFAALKRTVSGSGVPTHEGMDLSLNLSKPPASSPTARSPSKRSPTTGSPRKWRRSLGTRFRELQIPYSRFQIGCTEILLRPVIWNMEFAIWN